MNGCACKYNSKVNFFKVNDSSEIYTLLCQFQTVFPHLSEKIESLEVYAEKLSRCALCYKCVLEKKAVGILIFYANDLITRTAYISLIGILPEWQGKGLGQNLLDYCIAVSLTQGMKILQLEVDDDNTVAIRFYQKHGFIIQKNKSTNSKLLSKLIDNEQSSHNSYSEID